MATNHSSESSALFINHRRADYTNLQSQALASLAHEADRYGVTMPKGEMTRSEILRIANTITTRMKRVHGMDQVAQFWQRWRKIHDMLFGVENTKLSN